jgi:hypothetical protein
MQFRSLVDRLRLRPFADAVLGRFARCALFRIRLFNRIRSKKSALEYTKLLERTQPEQSKHIIVSVDDASEQSSESDNMESSLSSHASLSNDFNKAFVEEDDELPRRLIEMSRMTDEDLRSQAYMTQLRAIQVKENEQVKQAAELKRAKSERAKMMEEDAMSREVQRQRKGKIKTAKSNAMNAKASAHIQKAADRLRAARERKENQLKAKVALPAVTRKISTKKKESNIFNRSAMKQVTNNNKTEYLPEGHLQSTLSRALREKLLLRREKRLKTKDKMKELIAKRRALKEKEEHDRINLESQSKQKLLAEEKKQIEDARRRRRLNRIAEIKRLEKEILMEDSLQSLGGQNKENEIEAMFRSLTNWTRDLYGQK